MKTADPVVLKHDTSDMCAWCSLTGREKWKKRVGAGGVGGGKGGRGGGREG